MDLNLTPLQAVLLFVGGLALYLLSILNYNTSVPVLNILMSLTGGIMIGLSIFTMIVMLHSNNDEDDNDNEDN